MFKLLISDDEGKQTTVPLVRDEVTIGRKEGNTIRLTERNVSRRHARLQKQNGHYLLHDLGSYNGIVINGQRLLDSQALKHGDQILIGDYKLAILEEATSQLQAPPPSSNGAHETLDAIPPAAPPAPPAAMAAAPPPPPAAAPAAQQRVSGPPMAPPATAAAASMDIPDEIRNLRLVFLAPSGAPSPYGLDHLPIILGRSEVADISLPFSSISREHARLSMQGGSLVIEDLGSSNGVTVNGDKVPRAVITVGDHVALGVVEFRVAKRGEQTVVMNVPAEPATKSRSALGIVLALAGLGVIGGGVAIALKGSGSNSAAPPPTASAPELTTPSAAGPSTATVPTAAPTAPTNPVAVAPTQAAPQQPAAPTVAPAAPLVATADPPTQQPDNTDPGPAPAPAAMRAASPSSDHHTPRSSDSHGSSNSGSTTRVAMNPPPAQTNPNPPPAQNNPPPVVRAPVNPPPSNTTSTAGGGGDANPLDAARACRADNACVVAALEGRARTEQEVGLLAVTYRLMGNRPAAIRTMNRYLQRWPAGPRAEGFHNYIEAE